MNRQRYAILETEEWILESLDRRYRMRYLNLLLFVPLFLSASSLDDNVQRNETRIYELEQKIIEQNNRLDGLTTVLEGINAKLSELSSVEQNGSSADQSKLLKELAAMIDEINQNYVKKDEFYKALGKKNTNSVVTSSAKKETPKESSASNKELFGKAVTSYRNMKYKDAKELFSRVDKNGYKSAESNYYLGEISYYTKEYKDAIFYYKKSVGMDDDASYMDTLLLHTGISLENTNDKSQAKLFYEAVVAKYPNKHSANIAKKRLNSF
jgi:TolA-binding protein